MKRAEMLKRKNELIKVGPGQPGYAHVRYDGEILPAGIEAKLTLDDLAYLCDDGGHNFGHRGHIFSNKFTVYVYTD